jgi:mannose-1-phosphate guanylyltransferase
VTRWINAGAYVFRRSIIDSIPEGRAVSVERETFPGLLADGHDIRAWRESAYWCDVGTPHALVQCSADIVSGVAPTAAEMQLPGEAWFADAHQPPPDAIVTGGSSVGPGVHIGAGAVVDGSVLMAGAVIEAGASVVRSVVGHEARVGARSTLNAVVLADRAAVAPDTRLTSGELVEADLPANPRAN